MKATYLSYTLKFLERSEFDYLEGREYKYIKLLNKLFSFQFKLSNSEILFNPMEAEFTEEYSINNTSFVVLDKKTDANVFEVSSYSIINDDMSIFDGLYTLVKDIVNSIDKGYLADCKELLGMTKDEFYNIIYGIIYLLSTEYFILTRDLYTPENQLRPIGLDMYFVSDLLTYLEETDASIGLGLTTAGIKGQSTEPVLTIYEDGEERYIPYFWFNDFILKDTSYFRYKTAEDKLVLIKYAKMFKDYVFKHFDKTKLSAYKHVSIEVWVRVLQELYLKTVVLSGVLSHSSTILAEVGDD